MILRDAEKKQSEGMGFEEISHKITQQQLTPALLDDGEERFEKLDEDLIAVLQFKADVVRLHPRQVLEEHIKTRYSFIRNLLYCSSEFPSHQPRTSSR